jgi:hypothetical protein
LLGQAHAEVLRPADPGLGDRVHARHDAVGIRQDHGLGQAVEHGRDERT